MTPQTQVAGVPNEPHGLHPRVVGRVEQRRHSVPDRTLWSLCETKPIERSLKFEVSSSRQKEAWRQAPQLQTSHLTIQTRPVRNKANLPKPGGRWLAGGRRQVHGRLRETKPIHWIMIGKSFTGQESRSISRCCETKPISDAQGRRAQVALPDCCAKQSQLALSGRWWARPTLQDNRAKQSQFGGRSKGHNCS